LSHSPTATTAYAARDKDNWQVFDLKIPADKMTRRLRAMVTPGRYTPSIIARNSWVRGSSSLSSRSCAIIARAVDLSSGRQFPEAAMSKKGDRLRDKAEELRPNADNIRAQECHRISLELAEMAEELANQ
jgi:hypothetical protein